MATIRLKPDWTSLPQDLLFSIASLLHTRIDNILRFRAVCRSFRSTLPPPPKLLFPQSILRKTDFLKGPNPNDDKLFVLIESTVYAIQPLNDETSQLWLVKVEQLKPGRFLITNLLSRFGYHNLFEKLPRCLNLLNHRVTEVSKSYALDDPAIRKGKCKVYGSDQINIFKPPVFAKVIFTLNFDETDDRFSVMATYQRQQKLSMWRNTDKKWTNIEVELNHLGRIEDIIYHNENFYGLSSTGVTMTVDPKSLTVTEVASELPEVDEEAWLLYLVNSLKDLFLVVLYEGENDDIEWDVKVYKLNEEKREWVRVVDGLELEDRVFFVGETGSFSVSAREFSGCKANCVYFVDDSSIEYCNRPEEDARIFDLKDGKVRKFSDIPGCSNIFWPPPPWLK